MDLKTLQKYSKSNGMSVSLVKSLLENVKGTTFASITQITPVTLAAAHKHRNIKKITVANVQLFNNLKDFVAVYEGAVKRSAEKLGESPKQNVEDFTSSGNYFEHLDCFSITKHKSRDNYYLFVIYNHSRSKYFDTDDMREMTKDQVASLMTPSAAKKLYSTVEHNKTNDVKHTVQVRNVKLENVVRISTNHKTVEA